MHLSAIGRQFTQMNAYFLVMNSKRCIRALEKKFWFWLIFYSLDQAFLQRYRELRFEEMVGQAIHLNFRGVRQGFPLSPYLFILSAEILAKAVRKNNVIKGTCVNNEEIKLSQYADDTTFILDGTKESLTATFPPAT